MVPHPPHTSSAKSDARLRPWRWHELQVVAEAGCHNILRRCAPEPTTAALNGLGLLVWRRPLPLLPPPNCSTSRSASSSSHPPSCPGCCSGCAAPGLPPCRSCAAGALLTSLPVQIFSVSRGSSPHRGHRCPWTGSSPTKGRDPPSQGGSATRSGSATDFALGGSTSVATDADPRTTEFGPRCRFISCHARSHPQGCACKTLRTRATSPSVVETRRDASSSLSSCTFQHTCSNLLVVHVLALH